MLRDNMHRNDIEIIIFLFPQLPLKNLKSLKF